MFHIILALLFLIKVVLIPFFLLQSKDLFWRNTYFQENAYLLENFSPFSFENPLYPAGLNPTWP